MLDIVADPPLANYFIQQKATRSTLEFTLLSWRKIWLYQEQLKLLASHRQDLWVCLLKFTAKNRVKNWATAIDATTRCLEIGDLGSEYSDFITLVVSKFNQLKERGIIRKELNTNGLALVVAGCQRPIVALAASTHLIIQHPHTSKEPIMRTVPASNLRKIPQSHLYRTCHISILLSTKSSEFIIRRLLTFPILQSRKVKCLIKISSLDM